MLDTSISAFKNARDTQPVNVRLRDFLFSKKKESRVAEIRATPDKAARDRLKKELPAATISGTFASRNIAGIVHYNGLVCMDFDGKDNPDQSPFEMKFLLAGIEEVLYAGLSVSGEGVFAIIATDNDDPNKHGALCDYIGGLLSKAGLYYDRSCKDVCRLRFVSSDAGAHVNPHAPLLPAKAILAHIEQQQQARPPRPVRIARQDQGGNATTEKKVQRLVAEIEAQRADITANYEDWLYLAFALANEFGQSGEDYFQRISQFNPKYDPNDCGKKYHNALLTGSGRVKIGTFFKIATACGIRL
jgi:hypothetical protein